MYFGQPPLIYPLPSTSIMESRGFEPQSFLRGIEPLFGSDPCQTRTDPPYKLNQPEDAKGQVILYPLTPVTFLPGVPTFSLFIDDSVSSFNKTMATALPAFHL